MNANVEKLLARMSELEKDLEAELEAELAAQRRRFRYRLEKGRAAFEREAAELNARLRQGWVAFLLAAPLKSLLVAPVIYSLVAPLVLLDLWLFVYQSVCFPAYGIEKVERARYVVLDRGALTYLNWIERLNCVYCGYANGLVAYAREVASRTEQYFCPIKHARRLAGAHGRYKDFLDFGDADAYRTRLADLRGQLKP
ncbi:MAG: hypothetical protein KGM24_04485 [Elusimicrobia bacterium]|nr:hypothetical protein [Elusimicrobiota bacterium]